MSIIRELVRNTDNQALPQPATFLGTRGGSDVYFNWRPDHSYRNLKLKIIIVEHIDRAIEKIRSCLSRCMQYALNRFPVAHLISTILHLISTIQQLQYRVLPIYFTCRLFSSFVQ